MSEAKNFYATIPAKMENMNSHIPSIPTGFGGMFAKLMGEGSISVMQKELIALGIGVAQRCSPCIRMHVKKCLEAGATKDQILEAAGVAVMMGGGPTFMYTHEVIDALEALGH